MARKVGSLHPQPQHAQFNGTVVSSDLVTMLSDCYFDNDDNGSYTERAEGSSTFDKAEGTNGLGTRGEEMKPVSPPTYISLPLAQGTSGRPMATRTSFHLSQPRSHTTATSKPIISTPGVAVPP